MHDRTMTIYDYVFGDGITLNRDEQGDSRAPCWVDAIEI